MKLWTTKRSRATALPPRSSATVIRYSPSATYPGWLEPAGVRANHEPPAPSEWRSHDETTDDWGSSDLEPDEEDANDWESVDEPTDEWQSDLEALAEPEVPRIEPTTEPVTFSERDLSREERDEMIRNIGRGIFPS